MLRRCPRSTHAIGNAVWVLRRRAPHSRVARRGVPLCPLELLWSFSLPPPLGGQGNHTKTARLISRLENRATRSARGVLLGVLGRGARQIGLPCPRQRLGAAWRRSGRATWSWGRLTPSCSRSTEASSMTEQQQGRPTARRAACTGACPASHSSLHRLSQPLILQAVRLHATTANCRDAGAPTATTATWRTTRTTSRCPELSVQTRVCTAPCSC